MKKRWKKKLDSLLSLAVIVLLLPLSVTIIGQHMQLEGLVYGEGAPAAAEIGDKSGMPGIGAGTVTDDSGDVGKNEEKNRESTEEKVENTLTAQPDVEALLVGTVAKQIGVDAPIEAILAQCVIVRTSIYDARMRGMAEPEAIGIDEMQMLWGEDFEKLYRKMQECVERTKDEVLLWKDDFIYAAYHAMSAGKTRAVTEIYEGAKMPYLTETSCPKDASALGYLGVFYLGKEEFLEMCQSLFPESGITGLSELSVQSRDAAGYVKEIGIGNEMVSGEEFRKRFGWNSACFSIAETDGQVRIVTKGLGHGLGLSQNTAKCMAEEGKDYREILAFFYPSTELVKLTQG